MTMNPPKVDVKKLIHPLQFKVSVTARDIEKGAPGLGSVCAVALALKRRFGPRTGVEVGNKTVEVYTKQGTLTYRLDRATTAFIKRFDAGATVQPREVVLTRQL